MLRSIATVGIVAALLPAAGPARAADVFDAVRCGGDIPGVLVGKTIPNTPIGRLEARHAGIDIEVIGSFGLDNGFSITSFRICGTHYALLVDRRIRDAVALPPLSWTKPDLIGTCVRQGKPLPGTVMAILDNPQGLRKTGTPRDQSTFLPASRAWMIDEARAKFVALDVDGVTCPLGHMMDQAG